MRFARVGCAMILGVVLLCSCGCASTGNGVDWHEPAPRRDAREQITAALSRQALAWNRGDLEAFMEPYWRSPALTFSSAGVVSRGWLETLANFRTRYPTRAAMGVVGFHDLEFLPLGDGAMLVLGRWHLDRSEPTGGAFSLVWRRIDGAWVIVHDHTSTGPTASN